jgi:radical SAM superfamily enzyme YgiQ (UPF0313 family)
MFTTEYFLVDELVNTIRGSFPDATIILGGIHASIKPEWHFEESSPDFIVIGEGEETIVELLKHLKSDSPIDRNEIKGLCFRNSEGSIVKTSNRPPLKKLDYKIHLNNIILREDGTHRYIDKFSRKSPIYVDEKIGEDVPSIALYPSRGCPSDCDYCTASRRDGKIIRHMGAQSLWDYFYHARKDYNIRIFYNQSDTFGINENDWIFLRMVANYRKESNDENFIINNPNAFFVRSFFKRRGDTTIVNKERIDLIQSAGISVITLAIETFTPRFNKKINFEQITFQNILSLCEELKSRNIKNDIYMVYGYPGQEMHEFKNDCELISQLKPLVSWINWYFCILLPGSKYYEEAQRNGELDEKNYRETIREGYSFFYPKDEFNLSKIPTKTFIDYISEYGQAWV